VISDESKGIGYVHPLLTLQQEAEALDDQA